MTRLSWDDLPAQVRDIAVALCGVPLRVTSAAPGLTRGVACRLDTERGGYLIKAAPVGAPMAHHYVREQAANRFLPDGVPAPRMIWSGNPAGWIVMLFEWLPQARTADLSPSSAELAQVLTALDRLPKLLTPCPWHRAPEVTAKAEGLLRAADAFLADPSPGFPAARFATAIAQGWSVNTLRGPTLLHGDPHEGNFLIDGSRVYFIDWSLACRGAAWVDIALLMPRLIAAGHTPGQAEDVVRQMPAWQGVPADAVTAWAAVHALFAAHMARTGPLHHRRLRARTAAAGRAWVEYRLG